jgi:hypothetical protein
VDDDVECCWHNGGIVESIGDCQKRYRGMEPEPPAPLSSAPSQVLPECIQTELGVLPLKSLCEGFDLFRQHSPSNGLIESFPGALPVEERRWNWSRPELDVSQRPALNRLLSHSVKTTCSPSRYQHSLPSWFRLEYVILLNLRLAS